MTINFQAPELRELKPRIMVCGVGGAGCNAVNNMIMSGLTGVDFIVANTDAQALATSRAERIIQLGLQVTEGLGAGAQPEVGRAAAEETIEEIREHAQFVLVLAPEGTRKKVTQWRSGFWHVAKGAGIPICCVAFDFPRKVIRVGPTTMPDEDDPADGIARIRRYYADVQGRHPSQQA
jgi:hypothetical protein